MPRAFSCRDAAAAGLCSVSVLEFPDEAVDQEKQMQYRKQNTVLPFIQSSLHAFVND